MKGAEPPLERGAVLEAVREALPVAARAPSAHNTQPARWTVDASGRVVLAEDVSRWLPAADPTRRDHLLSLGAAWEGLDLALSRRGLGLGAPEAVPGAPTGSVRPVAGAPLVVRASPDPLADAVRRRRTWRGSFPPAEPARTRALRSAVRSFPGTTWIGDPAVIDRVAVRFDTCLVDALAPSPVLRELRDWMRLWPAEARSAGDGLTAPALRIPSAMAPMVGPLLRPRVFAVLRACGLARPVLSEAPATRSAAGIVVLCRHPDEPLLACGRRLYRVWLALTRTGFAACPMSALLDVPEGIVALRELATPRDLAVGGPGTPFSVLRVGPAPSPPAPESPRLPPETLLVEPGALS